MDLLLCIIAVLLGIASIGTASYSLYQSIQYGMDLLIRIVLGFSILTVLTHMGFYLIDPFSPIPTMMFYYNSTSGVIMSNLNLLVLHLLIGKYAVQAHIRDRKLANIKNKLEKML